MNQLLATFSNFTIRTLSACFATLLIAIQVAHSQPNIEWSFNFGGFSNDIPHSINPTSDGGFIACGASQSSSGDLESNNGGYDFWIFKLNSSGSVVWTKNYGGSAHDYAFEAIQTSDGGFAVTGVTHSNDGDINGNPTKGDVWMLKLTADGNLDWQTLIGGLDFDKAKGILETSTGDFVIGASSFSNDSNTTSNHGSSDYWLVKISNTGSIIWKNYFGGNKMDDIQAITETSDGGYVAVGNTMSENGDISNFAGFIDGWAIKIDANGNLVWSKALGANSADKIYDVVATSDGGLALIGTEGSTDLSAPLFESGYEENLWILKMDAAGNTLWDFDFGGSFYEGGFAISEKSDGNLVAAGYSRSADLDLSGNQGRKDSWIIELSSAGSIVWKQHYGGTEDEEAVSIAISANDAIAVLSNSRSSNGDVPGNNGNEDFWIIKYEGAAITPITVDAGNNQSICIGQSATLNAAAQNCGSCSYQWSNGPSTASQTVSPGATQSYTITVTDGTGQTATDNLTVTVNTLPSIFGNPTSSSCVGNDGSIDVSISGNNPFFYNWSNGFMMQDLTNVPSGIYDLTVTDGNNCTSTAQFTVGSATAIAVTSSLNQVECYNGNDGSIQLSASGGSGNLSYAWSHGPTMANVSGLTAGNYTVTISDANNCDQIEQFTITQPAEINISAMVEMVDCNGGNTGAIYQTVIGGTGNLTYNWSNGFSTQNLTNIPAGNYLVTVTDVNNCTKTNSYNISQSPSLDVTASKDNVSCNGGNDGAVNISVSGGNGDYNFAWSNAETTEDVDQLPAGFYSVTITDDEGCSSISSFNITEPSNGISTTSTITQASCFGDNDGAINLHVSGGNPNYQFVWDSGQLTEDISMVPSGVYEVTVTDDNQCTHINQFIINQTTAIQVTDVINDVSCFGFQNGAIDIEVTGGLETYQYEWSNQAISQDLSGLNGGTYFVTITDANQCQHIEQYDIVEPLEISILENVQHITCNGLQNGSINVNAVGGSGNLLETWNTTENLEQLPAGSYTITVTDASSCSVSETYEINEPEELEGLIDETNVSCNGESDGSIDLMVMGGTAGYTFQWSNSSIDEDLNNLAPDNYTVIITDANNCVSAASGNISEPTAIDVLETIINPTSNFSLDGSLEIQPFGGTGPYNITWDTGESGNSISGLNPGMYTVTVLDNNACEFTETFNLQVVANNEISNLLAFELTPNPNPGQFLISLGFASSTSFQLSIFNQIGQKIYSQEEHAKDWNQRFDWSQYPSGMYYIYVQTNEGRLTKKMIINR